MHAAVLSAAMVDPRLPVEQAIVGGGVGEGDEELAFLAARALSR